MGSDLKDVLKEWKKFYSEEYSEDSNLPPDDDKTFRKSKKEQIFQQVKVSPGGEYIAYLTNDWAGKESGCMTRVQVNKKSFLKQNQNSNR
jgi:hypothetical protein